MKSVIKVSLMATAIVCLILGIHSCGGASDTNKATEVKAPAAAPEDDGQGVGRFKNVSLADIDPKLADQGKALFDAKCSACHKPTDQKVVGPGLKGVTKAQKPAWILNMITNPLEMTQKDPTAKGLFEKHLVQMTFQDVNDDQARLILEYLRQNDQN